VISFAASAARPLATNARRRWLLVAVAVWLVPASALPASALARPSIASLRVTQTAVGEAGPGYSVVVAGHVRVCAQKGRLVVRVREQLTGFDDPPTLVAQNFRKLSTRQSARCQTHVVRWKLGDRFFGVGVYRLRFQAVDRDGVASTSVFRRFQTTD
jgi:hypothetical protein